MSGAILLDTGPIVAVLDQRDAHHAFVSRRLAPIRGRLITTGAVITEAASFLQDMRGGIAGFVEFITESGVEIWDCFGIETLRSAADVMAAYADTPMDFADATLVLAAEHYGTPDIATTDKRGFITFRFARNKPFRLVLQSA